MKVLLTGFEPFGEHQVNPSQQLISKLPHEYKGNLLIKEILPVHNQHGPRKLLTLLKTHQPDAVIAFGLASGRAQISLERVAINLMDYSIPDNVGKLIKGQPILEGAPNAHFSTLPLQSMHKALINAGIPSHLSLSAGAYLCNQVFFTLMQTIHEQNLNLKGGFVHLPCLPQQAAQSDKPIPSMSFDLMLHAAFVLIEHL